jgi:hypothetical protein
MSVEETENRVSMPFGAVVIPAYLHDRESVDKLYLTLQTIPSDLPATLIVAVQYENENWRQKIPEHKKHHTVTIESKKRLGKWRAISLGFSKLLGSESWIATLDGDASYRGEDISKLAHVIVAEQAHHVIGKRDVVLLRSRDDRSVNTRLYLEAYFNSLLLLILNSGKSSQYSGFDIQSGFQVFSMERVKQIRGMAFPFYGGEALLFYSSVKGGYSIRAVDVKILNQTMSTYSVEDMISNMFSLDFISSCQTDVFRNAVDAAISMYSNWIKDSADFRSEIDTLVLSRLTTG